MPVCKQCRNYVMIMPCPHCGNNESFFDRRPEEFKPIIPSDLQGNFEEPPLPSTSFHTADWSTGVKTNIPRDVSSDNSFLRSKTIKVNDDSGQFLHYSKSNNPSSSNSIENSDSKFRLNSVAPKNESEDINRLDIVEYNVQLLQSELITLKSDLQIIIKSQKIIETILTNLTRKISSISKK